jgi:hypothetical protein
MELPGGTAEVPMIDQHGEAVDLGKIQLHRRPPSARDGESGMHRPFGSSRSVTDGQDPVPMRKRRS